MILASLVLPEKPANTLTDKIISSRGRTTVKEGKIGAVLVWYSILITSSGGNFFTILAVAFLTPLETISSSLDGRVPLNFFPYSFLVPCLSEPLINQR